MGVCLQLVSVSAIKVITVAFYFDLIVNLESRRLSETKAEKAKCATLSDAVYICIMGINRQPEYSSVDVLLGSRAGLISVDMPEQRAGFVMDYRCTFHITFSTEGQEMDCFLQEVTRA